MAKWDGLVFSSVRRSFAPKATADLLFDEVDAVTAFGDAVFHLKAGVHFDEVGFTLRGDEELHRGEGVITHLADQHTGVFLQAFAQSGVMPPTGTG